MWQRIGEVLVALALYHVGLSCLRGVAKLALRRLRRWDDPRG